MPCPVLQIEDLNQQAQMAAAEKFKAPENPANLGEGLASTVAQPIQEESEEEDEVCDSCCFVCLMSRLN